MEGLIRKMQRYLLLFICLVLISCYSEKYENKIREKINISTPNYSRMNCDYKDSDGDVFNRQAVSDSMRKVKILKDYLLESIDTTLSILKTLDTLENNVIKTNKEIFTSLDKQETRFFQNKQFQRLENRSKIISDIRSSSDENLKKQLEYFLLKRLIDDYFIYAYDIYLNKPQEIGIHIYSFTELKSIQREIYSKLKSL